MKYNKEIIKKMKDRKDGSYSYKNQIYYFYENCKGCNEPFLGRKNAKYCSQECSRKKKYSKESRKKISESHKGKKHTEESKKKMSEAAKLRTGDKNSFFGKKHTKETKKKIGETKIKISGGYYSKSIPTYNTYSYQLEPYEKTKRNKQDPNILEVKCFKCDKWFVPKLWIIRNRILFLNNKTTIENRFYCSNECKNSCSIFHKSIEQIEKQDAIRAGRLSWLELSREVQPELRQLVLERDGNQCIKCNNKEDLQCHHILPVNIEPLLSADMDNCITLCKECHKKVHTKDGCKYSQLQIEEC